MELTESRNNSSAGQPACTSANSASGGTGVSRLSANFLPLIGAYVIVGRSSHRPPAPTEPVSPEENELLKPMPAWTVPETEY